MGGILILSEGGLSLCPSSLRSTGSATCSWKELLDSWNVVASQNGLCCLEMGVWGWGRGRARRARAIQSLPGIGGGDQATEVLGGGERGGRRALHMGAEDSVGPVQSCQTPRQSARKRATHRRPTPLPSCIPSKPTVFVFEDRSRLGAWGGGPRCLTHGKVEGDEGGLVSGCLVSQGECGMECRVEAQLQQGGVAGVWGDEVGRQREAFWTSWGDNG